MSSLLRKVGAWPVVLLKRQVFQRFLKALDNPEQTQQQKFAALLQQSSGSRFVQHYGLKGVRTFDDLRRALPILNYDDHKPFVESCLHGDFSSLFARGTKVHMFALTSGTTDAVKYIPVTSLSLQEYLESWSVWGYAVSQKFPEIAYGGIINLASSWRRQVTPCGLPAGSITGLLFEVMHKFLKNANSIPPLVSSVEDLELRLYLTLRLALSRNDTHMINVANPATLLQLAQKLQEWSDLLATDLRTGEIYRANEYPKAIRDALAHRLRGRHPDVAKRLLEKKERNGTLLPTDAWPNLKVIGVWTESSMASYLPKLSNFFPGVKLWDHGLSASEGRVSIPIHEETSSGVLNIRGACFEFIEEEAYGRNRIETLLPHQLEVGRRYYVVMTTSGGLFRYDLSDIVECTGFVSRTPRLRFLSKGKQFANLTGEKLSAYQAIQSVTQALKALDLPQVEYTLAPIEGDPPYYGLFIEDDGPLNRETCLKLAQEVDERLRRANYEYDDRRKTSRIAPLQVRLVQKSTFHSLQLRQMSLRQTPFEQYKHPFFTGDTSLAKQLLDRAESRGTP